MANRYAVANGNWSAPGTWDGGTTTPSSGDTVRTNNFTVTIDQTITVTELRNDASSPAVAGGSFSVTATGITINANLTPANLANYLVSCSAANLTLNGTISATAVTTAGGGGLAMTHASGALTFSGNISSAAGTSAAGTAAIYVTGNNATVASSGYTPTTGGGFCILTTGTSTAVTVTGNLTMNANNNTGVRVEGLNGTVTVNGNISSTSGTNPIGINLVGGNASAIINGNVSGGAGGTSSRGILNTSSNANPFVTVNGNVTGGGLTNSDGITATTTATGSIDITGNVTSGSGNLAHGVNAPQAITRVGGSIIQSTGRSAPVLGAWIKKSGVQQSYTAHTDSSGIVLSGTTENLIIDANVPPAVTDVRNGVSYGSGPWTGTMKVPTAASVAAGVPVDNTTGTAALKLSDVAAVTGAQMAAVMEKT